MPAFYSDYAVTTENASEIRGGFQAELTDITTNLPIEGATVTITSLDTQRPVTETLTTNAAGFTPVIELPAPPEELSQTPSTVKPYSEYRLTLSAPGYETIEITGAEIFSGVVAKQRAQLLPFDPALNRTSEEFTIPDHTLYGYYPPKILEEETKEIVPSGEIVLASVVIPEFIVVHDGTPNNTRAKNYTVPYRDYIKNVASSEIYATWPEATIYANILAIQSFTLNRVYTEW